MKTISAIALLGKDLKDFKVIQMILLRKGDAGGKIFTPLELYKTPALAQTALVQARNNHDYMDSIEVYVLTDEETFVLISFKGDNPIDIVDEVSKSANIKARALEKLSPEERSLLDLPSPGDLVSSD